MMTNGDTCQKFLNSKLEELNIGFGLDFCVWIININCNEDLAIDI